MLKQITTPPHFIYVAIGEMHFSFMDLSVASLAHVWHIRVYMESSSSESHRDSKAELETKTVSVRKQVSLSGSSFVRVDTRSPRVSWVEGFIDYPPEWETRIKNLCDRFPEESRQNIITELRESNGHAGKASANLSSRWHEIHDASASARRVESGSEDVTVEFEEVPLFKEIEASQTEAPEASGFMQGWFSCSCEPCKDTSGRPVVVSPLPNGHACVAAASA